MGEYLQEAVLPVQYDNYVFDLYGTLVDIHTEEDFPKLWCAARCNLHRTH